MRLSIAAALVLTVTATAVGAVQIPAGADVVPRVAAVTASAPNIVVIMTDDQPNGRLDAMPSVRRLIRQPGVKFSNAMVPTSLCCPSRTSFLTGRYSHETGIFQNKGQHGGWEPFHVNGWESQSLGPWLDDAGYETALVGKYLNGFHASPAGYTPPGWDTFFGHLSGSYYYRYSTRSKVNGTTTDQFHGTAPADYSTDVYTDQAVDAIERTPDARPLFLVYAPAAPHERMTPAKRHKGTWAPEHPSTPDINERHMQDKPAWMQELGRVNEAGLTRKITGQHESLMAVDEGVEAIQNALGDRTENTLFIFTSDNGLMLGSHRMTGKAVPHAAATEVPLILRWDGHIEPGAVDNRIALNLDLTKTILDAAGVNQSTSGRSLLSAPARRGTVLEGMGNTEVDRPAYCGWRTKRWLFVEWSDDRGQELYDYRTDPYELRNKAEDRRFRDRLKLLRGSARERCSPVPPDFSW